MIVIPLFDKDSDSDLTTEGLYRLVFSGTAPSIVDIPFAQRKTLNIPFVAGFTVWTEQSEKEFFVYLSFRPEDATSSISVKESKIPITLVYGAVGIIGLGVGSLFLKRVERVIDNPTIELLAIGAVLFGTVFLISKVKAL